MKATLFASCLALGTLVTGSPVLEQNDFQKRASNNSSFKTLLVFGDSLSDNGNKTWLFTNKTWPADPGYFNGRFSNGPVWTEYLVDMIGAQNFLDFAFGGATINNSVVLGLTGPKSDIRIPSVVEQVDTFLSTSLDKAEPSSTLTILLAGVNDAFFAASKGANVRGLTDSMVNSIKLLAEKGFRTFVTPQTQAAALLPFYALYGNASDIADQNRFSEHYKGNLTLSLQAAGLPQDVKLHLWDEYDGLQVLKNDAKAQGIQPEKPCLNGAYFETSPRTLCNDPEKYLFFDVFHPTTLTHQNIAKFILNIIAEAPVPVTGTTENPVSVTGGEQRNSSGHWLLWYGLIGASVFLQGVWC